MVELAMALDPELKKNIHNTIKTQSFEPKFDIAKRTRNIARQHSLILYVPTLQNGQTCSNNLPAMG